MKVLDKRVLVEEVATKIVKKIITLKDDKEQDYEISRKIIAVGKEVQDIKVGDIPCISIHAKPHYIKIIKQDDKEIITHLVFYNTDIAGIE